MAKQKPTLNETDLDLIEKRFESRFPTREDMDKRFETFLDAIKGLMEITFDEKIEERELVTKEDIKHLPTKDEYYAN